MNNSILEDVKKLVETLSYISRMRTMPSHESNTFTLMTAHKLADKALSTVPELLKRISELQGHLDMSNDALIEARATLIRNGSPDLPFLDDGIQNVIDTLPLPQPPKGE